VWMMVTMRYAKSCIGNLKLFFLCCVVEQDYT
jgi:hypothetical protein